jgi:hypothetical protein
MTAVGQLGAAMTAKAGSSNKLSKAFGSSKRCETSTSRHAEQCVLSAWSREASSASKKVIKPPKHRTIDSTNMQKDRALLYMICSTTNNDLSGRLCYLTHVRHISGSRSACFHRVRRLDSLPKHDLVSFLLDGSILPIPTTSSLPRSKSKHTL